MIIFDDSDTRVEIDALESVQPGYPMSFLTGNEQIYGGLSVLKGSSGCCLHPAHERLSLLWSVNQLLLSILFCLYLAWL